MRDPPGGLTRFFLQDVFNHAPAVGLRCEALLFDSGRILSLPPILEWHNTGQMASWRSAGLQPAATRDWKATLPIAIAAGLRRLLRLAESRL